MNTACEGVDVAYIGVNAACKGVDMAYIVVSLAYVEVETACEGGLHGFSGDVYDL